MLINGLQNNQNAVLGCFLLKLKDNSTRSTVEQMDLLLSKVNGKKLLDIGNGQAFLVIIPTMYKSLFESLQYIESIGGVTLTPRKISRIRLQESPEGELKERYIVQNNQIVRLNQLNLH